MELHMNTHEINININAIFFFWFNTPLKPLSRGPLLQALLQEY